MRYFDQGPDDRRLTLAILLSLLVHLAALTYLKPAWEMAQRGDSQGLLKVTLRGEAKAGDQESQAQPMVLAASPTPPIAKAETKAIVQTVAAVGEKPKKQYGIAVGPAANESNQGLSALLLIDASGRVGSIHWKQLPPMTDAALNRLEQRLRSKSYLATGIEYRVVEPLDPLLDKDVGN